MRRIIRLMVWVLAVVGALVCNALALPVAAVVCLAVMLVLLCTTPPHAIRLPRFASELFILLSTAIVHRPHSLLHLLVLAVLLFLLRLGRQSAWWAVLYAWFPW